MELLVSAAVATAFALGVAGASVSSIHMEYAALCASTGVFWLTIAMDSAHAVTCQSFSISWVGGTRELRYSTMIEDAYAVVQRHFAYLADAADPDPPILSITQSDNTFVWVPNVPPDTTVQLRLQDSAGTLGQTSSFNIQKGTDTSCVVQNPVAPNPSSGLSPFASPLASLSITSSAPSSRATISSSPVSSQAVASNLPSSGDTPNATDNRIVVAAVVPVCVSVFAVLLYYLFVRMRRRTTGARVEYPFTGKCTARSIGTYDVD
ncbi:MI domain-containing protein [Mycena kentingensis (nom. inval.)]|nr:MI domain-containing protein [Mycena kentingensis (nom. inval.)]